MRLPYSIGINQERPAMEKRQVLSIVVSSNGGYRAIHTYKSEESSAKTVPSWRLSGRRPSGWASRWSDYARTSPLPPRRRRSCRRVGRDLPSGRRPRWTCRPPGADSRRAGKWAANRCWQTTAGATRAPWSTGKTFDYRQVWGGW